MTGDWNVTMKRDEVEPPAPAEAAVVVTALALVCPAAEAADV